MEQPQKPGFVRRALKGLGWTVGVVVALFVIAVIYYRFDDELTAEAQAITAAPVKLGDASEDNGYIAMLGLSAPAGEDQMAWGRKALAAYQAGDVPGARSDEERARLTKNHLKAPARWCVPGKDCASVYKAKAGELAKRLEENNELLARYRVVLSKPRFEDAYVPSRIESSLPNYQPLLAGQTLLRAVIFAKATAGDAAGALEEMERDIAFYRRAVAGSRTLVGNVIVSRGLANDALLLSELMHSQRAAMAPHAARIARMLEGADAELDVRPVLQLEIRAIANTMRNPDPALIAFGERPLGFEKLFYRPNATTNSVVAIESRKLAALRGDASGYDKARAAVAEIDKSQSDLGWAEYARNPVGAMIVAMGGLSPQVYVGRMHDTVALLALVRAQAAGLEGRASKPEDIAALLSADGGKRFADPFTGKPFAFDAQSSSIWFTARAKGGWQGDVARKSDQRVAVSF